MENSDEGERTYLFSFSSGIQMASMFMGNWLGGYLPTWMGLWRGVQPTHSQAYAGALLVISGIALLGMIPLARIRAQEAGGSEQSDFAPLTFIKENPRLVSYLFVPLLLVSVGAGLFVPFLNLFFRVEHHQPDPVIGSLMAWGSLAMGIGFLIAPPIAERLGKIRMVVLTQSLSIPFMLILGFSPLFGLAAMAYYVRMGLMNMSGPIYQNFVLEQVETNERATVASMHSMIWSFGRSFSPAISGRLQVEYGFGPPFTIAIILYAISITMYWLFFLRKRTKPAAEGIPGD
jgi:MFS family permease